MNKLVVTPEHPEGILVPLTDAELAQVAADLNNYQRPSPLDTITAAVKGLPVEKRTNAAWGGFITQCLLSLEHVDMESFSYLVNCALAPPAGYTGFSTSDTDFVNILHGAKQLFNV
jgi:hypothetical protein